MNLLLSEERRKDWRIIPRSSFSEGNGLAITFSAHFGQAFANY